MIDSVRKWNTVKEFYQWFVDNEYFIVDSGIAFDGQAYVNTIECVNGILTQVHNNSGID